MTSPYNIKTIIKRNSIAVSYLDLIAASLNIPVFITVISPQFVTVVKSRRAKLLTPTSLQ